MMNLARIDHYRCGKPAGKWGVATYVWVPDRMEEDEFDGLCEKARKAYLDAEAEAKLWRPAHPPGYGPSIYPNTPDKATVAELRADYEATAAAYKEYQAKQDLARKPFSWHLQQASGGTIKLFWEVDPAISVEVDWGHLHGTTVDYGETKLGDYPPDEDDEL